jgi:hypothetical protein
MTLLALFGAAVLACIWQAPLSQTICVVGVALLQAAVICC